MIFRNKQLSVKVLELLSEGKYITPPQVNRPLHSIELCISYDNQSLFNLRPDIKHNTIINAVPSHAIINHNSLNMNVLCGARALIENDYKFENSKVHFSIRSLQYSQVLNDRLKPKDLMYDVVQFHNLAKDVYSAIYSFKTNSVTNLEAKINDTLRNLRIIP